MGHAVTDESASDRARAWTLTPQSTDGTVGERPYPDADSPDESSARTGDEVADTHSANLGTENGDSWRQRIESQTPNSSRRSPG
jgi:hypothetical protein